MSEDLESNEKNGVASPAPRPQSSDRKARLAARLRDNLRRRKDQARERKAAGDED